MSGENNALIERLQNSEEKLANLGKKVEELENKNQALVEVINATNQMFMNMFDMLMKNFEKVLSLLEQLPESIAKVAVEQFKKDLKETAKMLDKARKNSYIA